MKKLFILTLLLAGLAFGLSYFKNDKIASEFSKQIDTVSALSHGEVTCKGFINADCTIKDIVYQGLALADSLELKGIDPTMQFKEGVFTNIPLAAEIKNAKFSLFDISNMFKDDVQVDLKNFFTKYTTNYDIHIEANLLTDGKSARAVDIIKLDAEDKITPFVLSGKVTQLDTFPILNSFKGSIDFSNKHAVFNDFMKEMRGCCLEKIPARYAKMSDGEVWDDMIAQTSMMLEQSLKQQFNQDIETDMMKAMLALLKDEKNTLYIDVNAKKETPLEQTVMMFFIAGPDAVKEVYDIKVEAK